MVLWIPEVLAERDAVIVMQVPLTAGAMMPGDGHEAGGPPLAVGETIILLHRLLYSHRDGGGHLWRVYTADHLTRVE